MRTTSPARRSRSAAAARAGEQPEPPPQRAFDSGQRKGLQRILGPQLADRALPELEQAANALKRAEQGSRADRDKWRHKTQRLEDAAARLEKRAQRLLAALDEVHLLTPVPWTALLKPEEELTKGRTTPFGPEARLFVEGLAQEAAAWRKRAHLMALRPRGPDASTRRFVAEWVGIRLQRHGVRLSKGRDGQLARVLELVYAAGGQEVPRDMLDDLRWVVTRLQVEK